MLTRLMLASVLLTGSMFATVRDITLAPCNAVGGDTGNQAAAINTCIAALATGDTLFAPAGQVFRITSVLNPITAQNVTVNFSGSTIHAAFTATGPFFQFGGGSTT